MGGTSASDQSLLLYMALKGLMVLELAGLALSFPSAPPPPGLFLWTSHPVFRFQPTYLSNLRGAFAGLLRLLPGSDQPFPPALLRGAHGSLPSGCPVVPDTPAPLSVDAAGELWHTVEPSPQWGAVRSALGGEKGFNPPPSPASPSPVSRAGLFGAFPVWGLKMLSFLSLYLSN